MTVASAIAACGGGGGGGSSPPPQISITAQPADVHVLAGQSATFTVGTTGSVTYEWQRKISSAWTEVAGGNAAAFTLADLSTADSGSDFRVIVASRANPANTLTSSVVALTVDPVQVAPAVVAPPVDATVVEGNPASFSVTASGTSLSYQWQRSADGSTWTDVPGATTTACVFTVAVQDDGTLARVLVSNTLGTQTSATAQLHVTPAPVALTFTTLNRPGFRGDRLVRVRSRRRSALRPLAYRVAASCTIGRRVHLNRPRCLTVPTAAQRPRLQCSGSGNRSLR